MYGRRPMVMGHDMVLLLLLLLICLTVILLQFERLVMDIGS